MKLTPFVAVLAAVHDAIAAPSTADFAAPDNALPLSKATSRVVKSSAPRQPACNVESAVRHGNGANWAYGFGVPVGAWLGAAAGAYVGARFNDRVNRRIPYTGWFTTIGAVGGAAAGSSPGLLAGSIEDTRTYDACPAGLLSEEQDSPNCGIDTVDPNVSQRKTLLGLGSVAGTLGAVCGTAVGFQVDKNLGGRSMPRWTTVGAALGGAVAHGVVGGAMAGVSQLEPEDAAACPVETPTTA